MCVSSAYSSGLCDPIGLMPLFVCENCECVENTALGQFWTRLRKDMYPEPYAGKALCSACASPTYVDGTPTRLGEWHGEFPRRHISEYPNRENTRFENWPRQDT